MNLDLHPGNNSVRSPDLTSDANNTEGEFVFVDATMQPVTTIGADVALPADLMFVASSGPEGSINHMGVYLGAGQVICNTPNGVAVKDATSMLLGAREVMIWRRQDITSEERHVMVRWLRTQEGRPYGPAPTTAGQTQNQSVWFLSDLIFLAFTHIGKPLRGEDFAPTLPGQPITLNSIIYIGHLDAQGVAEDPLYNHDVLPQGTALGPFTPSEQDRDALIPVGSYGQSINTSTLEVGDLIVVSADHIVSEAIRRRTDSPASHVALYVGNGQVVEAITSGVVQRSLGDTLNETHYAAAYRFGGLSPNEKDRIRSFAMDEARRGASYDFLAIGSLQTLQDDDRWFCSELVFAAFKEAGIDLGNSQHSTPGQIIHLQGVEYLGHLPAQGDRTMTLAQRTQSHKRSRTLTGGGTMAKLGYEIVKSTMTGSSGDITFDFDQLRGKYSVQFPHWNAQQRLDHDAPTHPYTTVSIRSRQKQWDLGTISATVPISFDHNGHYISNVRLSRPGTNEHFAYSMDLAGEISENRNFYRNAAGEVVSRVDLKLTYVVDYDGLGESFYDDTAEIIENYAIYSDGSVWCNVVVQGTWWFDSDDARNPVLIENGELHIRGSHAGIDDSILQDRTSRTAGYRTMTESGANGASRGEEFFTETEAFPVHGSTTKPVQIENPYAVSASYNRHSRSLSSDRIENAVQVAVRNGATEEEARTFFAHEQAIRRRGARTLLATNEIPAYTIAASDSWISRAIAEVLTLAFPANNPVQHLFDFCTRNNVTIGIGAVIDIGVGEAVGGGFGVVVSPGNLLGYYGSLSMGLGYNFDANIGVQVTVIDGGASTFAGTSLVIGGSVDLSEGPSIGARLVLNTAGQAIGWTAEVTWSIGVPVASAGEFTVSIQETHARFARVRPQPPGAYPEQSGGPDMIGGLPVQRSPVALNHSLSMGWRSRAAGASAEPKRIWS